MEKETRQCLCCGKEFVRTVSNKKFCSRQCMRQYHSKDYHIRTKEIMCLKCGRVYRVSVNSNRTLCEDCRVKEKANEKKYAVERRRETDYAKREKMRAVKDSGLTYGQYTSGNRYRGPQVEGSVVATPLAEGWSAGWIPIGDMGAAQKPVRAKLKVDARRLAKPILPASGKKRKQKVATPYEDVLRFKMYRGEWKEAGEPYTESEDSLIIEKMADGGTFSSIGLEIGRTPGSVRWRYLKLIDKSE